uniref:Coronin n=1 Tax=Steinernema glaseri TaxID=37863 RepID=A0A1I8AQU8_9BILA
MAWRFQPSKFKNTAPKQPKKEDIIFDVPVGTLSCTNNGIQASEELLAFHIEGEGGKLGVLPIHSRGRRLRRDINVVCAHSELVTDFCFAPFDSRLLATCCRDEKLKLWRCDDFVAENAAKTVGDADAMIDLGANRFLECLAPHKSAHFVLAAGVGTGAVVMDAGEGKIVTELEGGISDRVQALDWSEDGHLLAASGDKGRSASIFDPRASTSPVHEISRLHSGLGREGRVLFADGKLVSSGFTNQRQQEVLVFDVRAGYKQVHQQTFMATTGLLIPLYDPDTKLLFLAGKGTNKLLLTEMTSKNPVVSGVCEHNLPEQLLGASIMSKHQCDVMSGEVQRVFTLTKASIYPIPCIVPRRTYRDFHADLYPDTMGQKPGCSAEQWLTGSNDLPSKVSLNPSASSEQVAPPVPEKKESTLSEKNTVEEPEVVETEAPKVAQNGSPKKEQCNDENENGFNQKVQISEKPKEPEAPKKEPEPVVKFRSTEPAQKPKPSPRASAAPVSASAVSDRVSLFVTNRASAAAPVFQSRPRPKSCVVGMVQSKFRHVETVVGKKGTVFTNVRNVNTRLPIESTGFCTSNRFGAIPLSGPAGLITIVELDSPCKLPDGVVDALQNRTTVTELQWNPFDETELAVGLDTGRVNIWRIESDVEPLRPSTPPPEGEEPKEGARRKLAELEPRMSLHVSSDKVSCLRYNPIAADILAVACSDCSINICDLSQQRVIQTINAHEQPILGISWSADGRKLASVAKDGALCVFEPQLGEQCLLATKNILESTRGARVLFVCDDSMILVASFSRGSQRLCTLYNSATLDVVHQQLVDTSPQLLIPHYDHDTSVLWLSGKGDRTVHMFEISPEAPFFMQLAPYSAPSGHQSIAMQNKLKCNVKAVEFQRGYRLTEKTLEQMIFKVPRVKKELFQRDLFPDALVTWKPAMTAAAWIAGEETKPLFQDLCPEGMREIAVPTATKPVAKAPPKPPRTHIEEAESGVEMSSPESSARIGHVPSVRNGLTEEQSKTQKAVESSWSHKIGVDRTLEQDTMDGVAEEEWLENED